MAMTQLLLESTRDGVCTCGMQALRKKPVEDKRPGAPAPKATAVRRISHPNYKDFSYEEVRSLGDTMGLARLPAISIDDMINL
jgi:hypothetical protein